MKGVALTVMVMIALGILTWLATGETTIYVVAFSPLLAVQRHEQT